MTRRKSKERKKPSAICIKFMREYILDIYTDESALWPSLHIFRNFGRRISPSHCSLGTSFLKINKTSALSHVPHPHEIR
jgi:hypothetical protein